MLQSVSDVAKQAYVVDFVRGPKGGAVQCQPSAERAQARNFGREPRWSGPQHDIAEMMNVEACSASLTESCITGAERIWRVFGCRGCQRLRSQLGLPRRNVDELRAAGTIRAVGIGVNEIEPCLRFAREGDFDCFLLAGRYTLLEHAALESLLPVCLQKNIGMMLGGPYNSGILATGAVAGAKYNYFPASPDIMERVARIEAVCRRQGIPIAAAALQFPLGHPAVSSIIPGAVTPNEVERNVALMPVTIPAALWAELKQDGLMPDDAPAPA